MQMILKTKAYFIMFALISAVAVAGCGTAQTQEAPVKDVKIVKVLYQADNSKAFIPQITGMKDEQLQAKINGNLKAAILALKNQPANSSLHGDFAVSFYNGNLLGVHFSGNSFTPGVAHPNKIDCGIHIDLTNGKVYPIGDLFKPGADFEKRIKALCAATDSSYRLKIDGLMEKWTNAMFTSSWTGGDRAFLLAAKSMRVYSIPSYAVGPISGYNVPYADLIEIINKDGELWKKLTSQENRAITVTAE